MEYTLKRLLTYSDKQKIGEFDMPEQVLEQVFEIYVNTKKQVPDTDITFVSVFNEVFHILTRVFNDETAADHVSEYMDEMVAIAKGQYAVQRYVFGFVWLLLKMHTELPKHARFFLNTLESRLGYENSTHYNYVREFLVAHPMQWTMPFPLRPVFSKAILGRSVDEWKEVTLDFDRETVDQIVQRFATKEERKQLIEELEKALNAANNEPGASQKVSMQTFKKKADESSLNQLRKQDFVPRSGQGTAEEQRIKQLEKQLDAVTEERDRAVRRLASLDSRVGQKYIPASFKTEEAERIINACIRRDLISAVWRPDDKGNVLLNCYRWDGSKALFGYFVDKMSARLNLYNAGKQVDWREFRHAFTNYEDIVKRARDAVSEYKQHPDTKKPTKAEIVDDIFANA